MAEIKFSCPQCGQHISCDEPWAGHPIDCPVCHSNIVVPQVPAPSAAPVSATPKREGSKPVGAKLAVGVTQVARSTAHAPAPVKRSVPPPPRGENPLVKYGVLAVVIIVLGGAGYFYGLPLLTNALDRIPDASTGTGASKSGGRGGPLGEMNDAMDVSETLDGGSSSPRPRPAPTTNNPPRSPTSPPRR